MARFTLLVVPDGRAVLTTTERLTDRERHELGEVLTGWENGQWPIVVLSDCETVQVAAIDIDLEAPAAAVAG